jgi:hypothetical protein
MVLAIRLWSCQNLAEVIQVLTRRQIVRWGPYRCWWPGWSG